MSNSNLNTPLSSSTSTTTSNTPNANNKRPLDTINNDDHTKKKVKKRRPGPLTIAEENFISNAFRNVKDPSNLSTDLKRMRRKFIMRETQRNNNLSNFNIDDKIHNYLVHTKKKDQKLSFYFQRDEIPCFQAKHLINIQSIFSSNNNNNNKNNNNNNINININNNNTNQVVQPIQQLAQAAYLATQQPLPPFNNQQPIQQPVQTPYTTSQAGPQLTKLPQHPPLPQTKLHSKLNSNITTTTTTTTTTNSTSSIPPPISKPLSPTQNYQKPIVAPFSPSKLILPLPNPPILNNSTSSNSVKSSPTLQLPPPNNPVSTTTISNKATINSSNSKPLSPTTTTTTPVNNVNNSSNNIAPLPTVPSKIKEEIEQSTPSSPPLPSTLNTNTSSIPVPMVVSTTTSTLSIPHPNNNRKPKNNKNNIIPTNSTPIILGEYPNFTIVHSKSEFIQSISKSINISKPLSNSITLNSSINSNRKNESLFKYYHWKNNQQQQQELNSNSKIGDNTFKKPFEILDKKILGRLTQPLNSYISPYTTRELKPFIRRDFHTVPRKLQLIRELYQFFILNDINKQEEEGDDDFNKDSSTITNKSLFKQLKFPIDYRYLTPDLADRVRIFLCENFWDGITIDDIMGYPDFTVCAMYKSMVIGCGIMNPDGYIMFISVHPEWQGYGIASFMLYHLTQTMVGKDITLHVSINNPALILYQQFAFKPEEYIQNFYDNYYTDDSGKSKNAFLLRLRR